MMHLPLAEAIARIRTRRPLILNITNFVVMEFSANALLALGASPIMTYDPEDGDELVAGADAVVINMGTPNPLWCEVANRAWSLANKYKKPVVFDPVGAGATAFRTHKAKEFLERHQAQVVRGNASEISALLGNSSALTSNGVDAMITAEQALDQITNRPRSHVSVISGPTDYIIGPEDIFFVQNGDPAMTSVTGMGCIATCLIAAFLTELNPTEAAVAGMALNGICGELAASMSQGPGSLRSAFIDHLAMNHVLCERLLKAGQL